MRRRRRASVRAGTTRSCGRAAGARHGPHVDGNATAAAACCDRPPVRARDGAGRVRTAVAVMTARAAGTFSAARSRALSARGLAATSSARGRSGRRVSTRTSAFRTGSTGSPWRLLARAPVQRAKRSFTMRSSSEWYASTSTRPPGREQVHRLVEARRRGSAARGSPPCGSPGTCGAPGGGRVGAPAPGSRPSPPSTRSAVVASGRPRHDLRGDPAREALLAVPREDRGEIGLGVLVDHRRRR